MKMEIDIRKMSKEVADKALNEVEYRGKTIREWIELFNKYGDDKIHGFWNAGGYACGETEFKCSVCNETEWRTSIDRFKYCPFCGARMDGDPHDGT